MSEPISVIERLRYRRNLERMSQYHLARQIGVTRSALASYEAGRVPVPFNVGMAICRIFNLNPEWVVEGKGLGTPFVTLSELKLSEDDVLVRAQGMSFEQGYKVLLKHPLMVWAHAHPDEEIIHALVTGDADNQWRSMSVRHLEEVRRECLEILASGRYPSYSPMVECYRNEAKEVEDELAFRRAGRKRSYTKREEKQDNENKVLTEKQAIAYKFSDVKGSLLSHWIARANALVSHRGGKSALARHLGVKPQSVHGFLTGASAPSAENILRLQAWVIETEAKKESSESVSAPSEQKTQKRKSDHENTQSSQGTS